MSWQTVPLGDICDVIGGGTPSKSRADFYEGDIPWASIRDMQGDWVESTEFSITRKAVASSATNVIPAGNVIIATRVGLGKVARLRRDTAINQDIRAVVPRDDKMLDKQYLFYWFKSIAKIIESEGKGATVKGVTLPFVKSLQLPLPTLPEQHRIVALLDEAFAGIAIAKANAEKSLLAAQEAFDLRLASVFSGEHPNWSEVRLEDVCAITSALVDPRAKEYMDAIHVGAGNIESRTGRLIDLKTSCQEGLISGKFPFDPSMVLYSKIRPYLMKVARPDFTGICSADMYPLTPIKGKADRDFLYYLLLSKPFTDYAILGSARAGMPKVNREHLFQYTCSTPDVASQAKIAEELDELWAETQHLQSLTTRKLAALDELKQSLLQRAFSGQL